MPTEFLLGEGLGIKEVHYAERLSDQMNIDKIRNFAEDKTTAAQPPTQEHLEYRQNFLT